MNIWKGFIVLEGLDGAGTTTQSSLLAEAYKTAGKPAWFTCEPTKGPIGSLIRKKLSGSIPSDPRSMALLFAADRREHLYLGDNSIENRIRRGEAVVTDRYLFSSLAYQSIEAGFDYVYALNKDFPLPEYLFFLTISPDTGEQRLKGRTTREVYENLPFQEKVKVHYQKALSLLRETECKIIEIDGELPPHEIHRMICSELDL